MATYLEIRALTEDSRFRSRLQVAIWKKARAILLDAGSTQQAKLWAKKALGGALDEDQMRRVSITVASAVPAAAAVDSFTDADIQTQVDGLVTELF